MMRKPYTLAAARDVMSQDKADGYPQWNVPDFICDFYATTEQARTIAHLVNGAPEAALDAVVVPGVVDALVTLADAMNELFEGAGRLDKHIRADTIVEYHTALVDTPPAARPFAEPSGGSAGEAVNSAS